METPNSEQPNILLVGVASSAGGLNPLVELLEEAQCNSIMSFALAPHLSREFKSELPRLLKKFSKLKVVTIEDGMSISACHIYVLPPNYYVQVVNFKFSLTKRSSTGTNNAGDALFESLANSYNRNAIGVVLSGSAVGADGSKGVRAIKLKKGLTFAQEPRSAQFPHMPLLAISTSFIDIVAGPREIGKVLAEMVWYYEH